MLGSLYIGTSGYSYSHWEKGVFYPKGLPKSRQLEYYSQYFNTVEMNYPFYRLPSSKSFSNWRGLVPKDFIFSVKVSRYITHIKHFHHCQSAWKVFLKRALGLGNKLGPFLFQLPPNWKKDPTRLKEFLEMINEGGSRQRFVLEFRHPSWFSEDIYQILNKKKNVSFCLADSPQQPLTEKITGNFVYVRMHGGKVLYTSNYTKKELASLANKIKKWLKRDLDVYLYFNNDAMGHAPGNARKIKEMIGQKTP